MFVWPSSSAMHVELASIYLLNWHFSHGTEEIHVPARDSLLDPVGQGRAAGNCLQAMASLGLKRNYQVKRT